MTIIDEVRSSCRHLSPCIYPECNGGATRCDRYADGLAAGLAKIEEFRALLLLERQNNAGINAELFRVRQLAKDAEVRFQIDRRDHDLALRDALSETARTADELAFWRYQAIWGRWYLLDASVHGAPLPEETAAWKEAERQLEETRVEENRERHFPEAPRDPGAT